MDRKYKIKDAVCRLNKPGTRLSTAEIIDCVISLYPEIPSGSILPSDLFCNHKNKDPFSGKYHIFRKIRYAYYELL
jgi:hypothetical protein